MNEENYDAVIIGGGIAGLSAAQALGRSLRRTLVVDAGEPRNRYAAHMHNVLGHDTVSPLELLARGRSEARAYGVEIVSGRVSTVRDRGEHLEVELETGDGATATRYRARAMVVASGVRDDLPDIPGLADYWGSSVLHCPYCHGWEVRGRSLGVLATSAASLHQVSLIPQWSKRVTVFAAGLGELQDETLRSIRARGLTLEREAVAEVLGDGENLTGVRTLGGTVHQIDALFTLSAMVPLDGFLAGLTLDRGDGPFGSFLTVDAFGRTSHPRVWAAGNITAPMATVPIVMGAGAQAGAGVNAALAEEDTVSALRSAG